MSGSFSSEVAKRSVAQESFVDARITDSLYYAPIVRYSTGPVGSRTMHTGLLRRVRESSRRHFRGVCPELYIRVYIEDLNKAVFAQVGSSTVLDFGEFRSMGGPFLMDSEKVLVRLKDDSVVIEGAGEFDREDSSNDLRKHNSSSLKPRVGRKRQFEEHITTQLRQKWARNVGIYESEWEVTEAMEDGDKAFVRFENGEFSIDRRFSVSDWEDNEALQRFIEDGVTDGLEGESVIVSLEEYEAAPICKSHDWNVYLSEDLSSSIVRWFKRKI